MAAVLGGRAAHPPRPLLALEMDQHAVRHLDQIAGLQRPRLPDHPGQVPDR
ncbi:hypothetical protein ACU4GR_15490 [Methylobacterium oryzae CBMB20]